MAPQLLLALVVKVSVLMAVALLASMLLRDQPARTRHRWWSALFVGVLVLPVLTGVMPTLEVPLPAAWTAPVPTAPSTVVESPRVVAATEVVPPERPDASVIVSPAAAPGFEWPPVPVMLMVVWLVGTMAAITMIVVALVRVRRMSAGGEEIVDGEWRTATEAVAARLGLRRPIRLVVSPVVETPMAGGLRQNTVFLPPAARHWDPERRDIVLAHELLHLAGRDPLRHLVSRLAVSAYWFHPLAWLTAREASITREQACDESVLALGVRQSTYARVLLDLAETAGRLPVSVGALPAVQRTSLEKRLMKILNHDVRTVRASRTFAPVLVIACLTLAVAAARPAAAPAPSAVVPIAVSSSIPTPAPMSAPLPVPASPAERASGAAVIPVSFTQTTACEEGPRSGGFSGSITINKRDQIVEQAGTRGSTRLLMKTFGDLQVCVLAEDRRDPDDSLPSDWMSRAGRVVLESRRASDVHRLETVRTDAGLQVSWRVNGTERPVNAEAREWRDRMLALADTAWESSRLRGELSSLQGEISSIQGERSSLEGEISSLYGEVSSMEGEISALQGQDRALRGTISAIHGRLSAMQGEISALEGAISSLTASKYGADARDLDRINARIADYRRDIARVEQEIRAYDADGRVAALRGRAVGDLDAQVAAVRARIRDFDVDAKVAAVQRQIRALDVEGKVREIERRITALDADRRAAALEARLNEQAGRLRAAVAAVRTP